MVLYYFIEIRKHYPWRSPIADKYIKYTKVSRLAMNNYGIYSNPAAYWLGVF